jgi:hypothetical protein
LRQLNSAVQSPVLFLVLVIVTMSPPWFTRPSPRPSILDFVTAEPEKSPHVTDNVTDDLEKNLGKTVFVTMSPINTPGRGGAPKFDVFLVPHLPAY